MRNYLKEPKTWIKLPEKYQKVFECWDCDDWAIWRHKDGGTFCQRHKRLDGIAKKEVK